MTLRELISSNVWDNVWDNVSGNVSNNVRRFAEKEL